MTIVDRDKIITEEKEEVKKFKDHFEEIVKTLKINRPLLSDLYDDPVLNALENSSQHASLLKIKQVRISSDLHSSYW